MREEPPHSSRMLLPIVLGSVGLGERIGVARTGAALVRRVKDSKHWRPLEVGRAVRLLCPVVVAEDGGAAGSRDWIVALVGCGADEQQGPQQAAGG